MCACPWAPRHAHMYMGTRAGIRAHTKRGSKATHISRGRLVEGERERGRGRERERGRGRETWTWIDTAHHIPEFSRVFWAGLAWTWESKKAKLRDGQTEIVVRGVLIVLTQPVVAGGSSV